MAQDWCWIDGERADRVPFDDRGLALADGVFETLRLVEGEPRLLGYHQERMTKGLSQLWFDDSQKLAEAALAQSAELVRSEDNSATGVLRVTVTRGSGPRGYRPPASVSPRIVARFSPGLPESCSDAALWISSIHWPAQPAFAGSKLLARHEQVVAAAEAQAQACDDALMLDAHGNLLAVASGNLFLRVDQTLYTPELSRAGIAGTRRRAVIAHVEAERRYEMRVAELSSDVLNAAEEVFYCNSVLGVRPVASIRDGNASWQFDSREAADWLRHRVHQLPGENPR